MSLKAFHIFFVTISGLLSLFLLVWGYRAYLASSDPTALGLSIAGLMGLVLLIPYGRWFLKKSKGLLALAGLCSTSVILSSPSLWACAVCFGDPSSSMVQGIKAGIWVLIAVIGGVLFAVASIAYSWHRRAKALESS